MGKPKQDKEAPQPPDTDAPAAAESDEDCAEDTVTITPGPGHVGEEEGNLGRRSDWFRKRSGG